jgi:hypothetical protein
MKESMNFVTEEATLIFIILGKVFAESLSAVSSSEAKSWW